ncbi:uncharacterized protein LOC134820062 [Bolinopsis microptera]|uniref:uncharacterized protein LOC134820062 n=1 Tax=Bolinopsis microptera TaxID=2820187 RepID=UPI0030792327
MFLRKSPFTGAKWFAQSISRKRFLSSSPSDNVRIGCFSGFWGDSCTFASQQLVNKGSIDFLVGDYLAEVTMSILAAMKKKKPELGFCPDFFEHLAPNGPKIVEKKIKVVVNAGGLNPDACAKRLGGLLQQFGLNLKVASVVGDDLINQGIKLPEIEGIPYNTMNCYLGAEPIAKALDNGADIVITGRCVDSALVLGPLIHRFGWNMNEFDKLAQGSLAGHIVECGAQSTGGNFTDWHQVPDYSNVGFPIVDVQPDGVFKVTKPVKTGGLVSFGTVAEQMLYEIGDSQCYALPDVNCDFANVSIKEVAKNEVEVSGAVGKPPSSTYKVSATYIDGYKATSMAPMIGPNAAQKGHLNSMSTIERCEKIFSKMGMGSFEEVNVECLGSGSNYGKDIKSSSAKEVVVWTSVRHKNKAALEMWAKEIAGASTGMAPGFTTLVGGRPKPTPILRYKPFFYPKDLVNITVDNAEFTNSNTEFSPVQPQSQPETIIDVVNEGECSFRLEELAFLRSGDKGNSANLGIICRNKSLYKALDSRLTSAAVKEYLSFLGEDLVVTKYNLPGTGAFNFVLDNALGGGGVASLKTDPQGKAIGQIFSDFVIEGLKEKSCYLS